DLHTAATYPDGTRSEGTLPDPASSPLACVPTLQSGPATDALWECLPERSQYSGARASRSIRPGGAFQSHADAGKRPVLTSLLQTIGSSHTDDGSDEYSGPAQRSLRLVAEWPDLRHRREFYPPEFCDPTSLAEARKMPAFPDHLAHIAA